MRVIRLMLILLGIFITIGMIKAGFEISYWLIFGKAIYSNEAAFQIPNTDVEIILERRAIHLFLAEYERTLVLRIDEKEVLRQEVAADSGGYSRMNIYETSPTEYFLSGDLSHDKYELDVTSQKISGVVLKDKPSAAKFVGAFDVDEKRVWRFTSANERGEQKSKFEE